MPAFPPAKPQRVGSWSQRSRLESAAHLPRPPRAGVSSGRLCHPQCGRHSLGDRSRRARCVQAPARYEHLHKAAVATGCRGAETQEAPTWLGWGGRACLLRRRGRER